MRDSKWTSWVSNGFIHDHFLNGILIVFVHPKAISMSSCNTLSTLQHMFCSLGKCDNRSI